MSHDPDQARCDACGRKVWLEAGFIGEHSKRGGDFCPASQRPIETVEECATCGGEGVIHYSRRGVTTDHKCGSECEECSRCAGLRYIVHAYKS